MDVFGTTVKKLTVHAGNLSPSELHTLIEATDDATSALVRSNGTQEIPSFLRSPDFFESVVALQADKKGDEIRNLPIARINLRHWFEAFISLAKPALPELKLVNDSRIMMINQINFEIKKAKANGVNEKMAMHDNSVRIGAGGKMIPNPPRDLRPSVLAENLVMRERIFQDVWMSFMLNRVFDTIELRKAYFLSKGISADDLDQLVKTLPEYWRDR